MERLKIFEAYASHPWLYRSYKRLTPAERDLAHDFIRRNDHLAKGPFEFAVNRMFLDKPKPKHCNEILELLTCANSAI
jgi:hypothetical protein